MVSLVYSTKQLYTHMIKSKVSKKIFEYGNNSLQQFKYVVKIPHICRRKQTFLNMWQQAPISLIVILICKILTYVKKLEHA